MFLETFCQAGQAAKMMQTDKEEEVVLEMSETFYFWH